MMATERSKERGGELARVWTTLCGIPTFDEAWVTTDGTVLVRVSRSDPTENKKTSSVVAVSAAAGGIVGALPFSLGDTALAYAPSPSGSLHAVLRAETAEKKDSVKIEVWDRVGLLRTVDASAKHGQVLSTDTFGSVAWDPTERFLAYVAEPSAPLARSFWESAAEREKRDKEEKEANGGAKKQLSPMDKFKWREDWGEKFGGVRDPSIFVADTVAGTVTRITPVFDSEALDRSATLGQVTWASPANGILQLVFVAWENEPRRLGISFCTNRKSSIWRMSYSGQEKELASRCSPEVWSSICPRVAPDGKTIVMATTNNHMLHKCVYSIGTVSPPSCEFLGVSGAGAIVSEGVNTVMPNNCFVDGTTVLASTPRGFQRVVLVCDLAAAQGSPVAASVLPLPDGFEHHSAALLAAGNGTVVVAMSTPTSIPVLAIGKMAGTALLSWSIVGTLGGAVPASLYSAIWEISEVVPTQPEGSLEKRYPFEVLLLRHSEGRPRPLVAMIHGGPHSAFSSAYSPEAAFLLMAGMNVLMVNYTGSACFGEAEMDRLRGHVGTLDVMDCEDAIRFALASYPNCDHDRIYLYGGSHGGFLIGHLISRATEGLRYVAASVRNPVWNMATMFDTSDIPDWTLVESGADAIPDPINRFQSLFGHSPALHSDKAMVPCALFLGQNDKRCPNEQGLAFHRALKARGVESAVWIYPEGHSIMRPQFKGDCLVNSVLWYERFSSQQ